MEEDLDRAWEVLGEAVQTVMRAHGIPDAYDKLEDVHPGPAHGQGRPCAEFIASLDLPPAEKAAAAGSSTPRTYVGLAPALALRRHSRLLGSLET